jgi:hypothetical protein
MAVPTLVLPFSASPQALPNVVPSGVLPTNKPLLISGVQIPADGRLNISIGLNPSSVVSPLYIKRFNALQSINAGLSIAPGSEIDFTTYVRQGEIINFQFASGVTFSFLDAIYAPSP